MALEKYYNKSAKSVVGINGIIRHKKAVGLLGEAGLAG